MANTRGALASAFHELKERPPAVLARTRKKEGAGQANKQRVAIAFSKARAAGAKIPEAKCHGGPVGKFSNY